MSSSEFASSQWLFQEGLMSMSYSLGNGSSYDPFKQCDIVHSYESSQKARNVYISVYCLMLLVSVVTNSMILFIIVKKRLWRDVSVIMIGNLAVNDMLVCVAILVPEISKWLGFFEDNSYKSIQVCRVHMTAEALFPTVTIFSLVVMSYERFRISRAKILTRGQPNRRFLAAVTVILVWIIALASSLPVVKSCVQHSESFSFAEHWSPFMVRFTFIQFILVYITPLILIAVFYSYMAASLFGSITSNKNLKNTLRSSSAGRRAQRGRRRLAAMVITLVVVFAVGWLPHYIFLFLTFFGSPDIFCTGMVVSHLTNFQQIFYCLVSLLNPFIVFVIGANFRRFLLDMIPCSFKVFRGKAKHHTTSVTWASRTNHQDDTEGVPLNSVEHYPMNGKT